jgi:hypothetical protein
MDEAITQLVSIYTLLFMLGCWVLTFLTRRVVETAIPSLKKKSDENDSQITYTTPFSRWWNQVLLYFIPTCWGMLGGASLGSVYPFPEGIQSMSGRIFFGMVCGFFCTFGYKLIMFIILQKFKIQKGDLPDVKEPEI